MILEHFGVFGHHILQLFLEAIVIFSMDEIVVEEHEFVHLLLCLFIALALDFKQLAGVLVLDFQPITSAFESPNIVFEHHNLRLVFFLLIG